MRGSVRMNVSGLPLSPGLPLPLAWAPHRGVLRPSTLGGFVRPYAPLDPPPPLPPHTAGLAPPPLRTQMGHHGVLTLRPLPPFLIAGLAPPPRRQH